jgi:hypothetical protein
LNFALSIREFAASALAFEEEEEEEEGQGVKPRPSSRVDGKRGPVKAMSSSSNKLTL